MFESTLDEVSALGDALGRVVDALEPDAMTATTADQLWVALDRVERLAASGKVVLARRAVQAPPPQSGRGAAAKTPTEALAARAGTSLGAAREALETSQRIQRSPALDRAVRQGRLSAPQAAAVGSAVAADPDSADRLVELAESASLAELRDECARTRAAADPDPAARNARLHRARRLRRFTDHEGAWQLLARGTPQAGAAFNAVLDPLIDQVFQAARRSGRAEALEAYAFDALMAMADLAAGEQPAGDGLDSARPAPERQPSEPLGGLRHPDDMAGDPPGPRCQPPAGRGTSSPTTGSGPAGREPGSPTTDSRPTGEPNGTSAAKRPAAGLEPQPPVVGTRPADDADAMSAAERPAAGPADWPEAGSGDLSPTPSPAETANRLDDLPWWAAAQGVPLGDPVPLSDVPDRRPCAPPPSTPPWWRDARLLHPGTGDPDAESGDAAPDGARTDPEVLGRVTPMGVGSASARDAASSLGPDSEHPSTDEPPDVSGRHPSTIGPERATAPRWSRSSAGDSVGPTAAHRRPGPSVRRNPRHLALVRVDLTALRRGSVEPGETCEIAGVGPVPVDVARELLGDAVLKLVITRGVDVLNVTHLGRGPTAAQRIALTWQSPGCAVLGCPRRRVEIDHREPWARTRHTRLDELDPLCAHHHDLKTRRGWALVAGTGRRDFVPPTDSRHPRHQATASDRGP